MKIEETRNYIRIKRIEFKDFRNIESGTVDFPNANATEYYKESAPSILGLYGQNGSGKSSVIMALGILKNVLSGRKLEDNYASCIRVGCEKCSLSFTFSMYAEAFDSNNNVVNNGMSGCYEIFYDFDIIKKVRHKADDFGEAEIESGLFIENEILKIKITDSFGKMKLPKQVFFDTRKEVSDDKGIAFGNEQKYWLFTKAYAKEDQDISINFKMAKVIANENGTSFLFSAKFTECLEKMLEGVKEDREISAALKNLNDLVAKENGLDIALQSLSEKDKQAYGIFLLLETPYEVITSLNEYGRFYLHVVDTATTGMTNINTRLPLLLWWNNNDWVASYRVSLLMDKPTVVSEERFTEIITALQSVSDVLGKIVPDMSLSFDDLGAQRNKDGELEHRFEILSQRNGKTIPLKYESDGIRRMVSILSLLIAVYNEASFTVAIDEIDSGIFEYLLGELLAVMSDSIKGQFIFTSHNLRPLEVLPAKYLCFTTTNPGNRFTTLPRRGNSNLRDTYFRNIALGSDKESVYNSTDRFEIEKAFYQAGHFEESSDE